jgi:hypothetical protein
MATIRTAIIHQLSHSGMDDSMCSMVATLIPSETSRSSKWMSTGSAAAAIPPNGIWLMNDVAGHVICA